MMDLRILVARIVLMGCICCSYKASFNDILSIEDTQIDTTSYLVVFTTTQYTAQVKVRGRHESLALECCEKCYERTIYDKTVFGKIQESVSFYLDRSVRLFYDCEKNLFVVKARAGYYLLAIGEESILCLRIDDFETDLSDSKLVLNHRRTVPVQFRDVCGLESINTISSAYFTLKFGLDDLMEIEESKCRGLLGMSSQFKRLYMEQVPASMSKAMPSSSAEHVRGFEKYSKTVDIVHPHDPSMQRGSKRMVGSNESDSAYLQSTLDQIRALKTRNIDSERK